MITKHQIKRIPEVPDEIIQAVNDKKLAVFMGAGVSRLLGCYGWDKLAWDLIGICLENGYINFKEKEILSCMQDQKKVITMCYGILKSNNEEKLFYTKMEESLRGDPEKIKNKNIYDEISDFKGLFITTNADKHFDCKFLPGNIKYKMEDFNPDKLKKDALYHIHGCIEHKNSLVFTVDEYIKRYNDGMFGKFMGKISEEYIVLFIGYGLAEFEILDFVITKFYEQGLKKPKHYALIPYFKGEENICGYEQYYYERLGINIVPYSKDELGYEQLYEVMKNWRVKINSLSMALPKSFRYIKEAVENYNEVNLNKMLQLIKNNKAQENELFDNLATTDNPFPWFKELYSKEYFCPYKNLKPMEDKYQRGYYSIPKWNVLDFLYNISNKNKKSNDLSITKLIIKVIDAIIDYTDDKGNRIENYRTDNVIIEVIMNLPQSEIKEEHISFIITALKSKWNNGFLEGTLSKYDLCRILNKELMMILLTGLLNCDIKKEGYWLEKILTRNKKDIGDKYPINVISIVINKIDSIISEDENAFSVYVIATIEDIKDELYSYSYKKLLISFLRDMLQFADPKDINQRIEEMMTNDNSIYIRLAVHTINYHYDELKNIFWKLGKNPLEETDVKYEIYKLFKNRAKLFIEDEINKAINWIENKNYYVQEGAKDDINLLRIAYAKKEFLNALLESENEEVIELYYKYNMINPNEIKHPGRSFYIEDLESIKYISSLTIEDFERMSSIEIADYLNDFKETSDWKAPSKKGLSETFERYIIKNFSVFIDDLNDYLDISVIYQDAIINAFQNLDLSNKGIYIDKILDFLDELSDKLFIKMEDKNEHIRYCLLSVIGFIDNKLLKLEGLNSNEALNKIKYILIKIIRNVKEEDVETGNYVTSAFSMIKGTSYIALIGLSSKEATLKYSKDAIKWESDIKEFFTSNLDKTNETSLYFVAVLGMFLPQLMYIDKDWVVQHFDEIFNKGLEKYWKVAMESYLGYSKFYLDIYKLMKEHGNYEKALNFTYKNEEIGQKIVEHICVAYLNGEESLIDNLSLINKLLNRKDIKELEQIISFMSTGKSETLDKNMKLKIKELWGKLIEVLESNLGTEESHELLYKLCDWINLIDELGDDVFEWVKKYCKYCRHNYETYFITDGLLKHIHKEPDKVADIFIEMIDHEIYLDDEDNIKIIVKNFYDMGMKKQADQICNSYLSIGAKFLQDIYDEFNN